VAAIRVPTRRQRAKYATVGHAGVVTEDRRPIDLALDVFLYAPVGASLELWERVPDLAEAGRKRLSAQAPAAKMVGRFAVSAGMSKLEERLGDFAARGRQAASTEEAESAEKPDVDDLDPRDAGSRPATARHATAAEQAAPGEAVAGKKSTVDVVIGSYDELRAIEIVALLPTLSAEERAAVRVRELDGRARRTILAKLDRLDSISTGGNR